VSLQSLVALTSLIGLLLFALFEVRKFSKRNMTAGIQPSDEVCERDMNPNRVHDSCAGHPDSDRAAD
jgi:hypothetical protein